MLTFRAASLLLLATGIVFSCSDGENSGGASATASTSAAAGTGASTKATSSVGGPQTTGISANASSSTGTGGAPGATIPHVYVGAGNSIEHYMLDRQTGALMFVAKYLAGQSAGFLAADPSHRYIYSTESGNPGRVRSFAIDLSNGSLSALNDKSSEGAGPAHVSVHPSGSHVFVANYSSGHVAALPINSDGSLADASDVKQAGDKAHLILPNPKTNQVYAPCLGANHVWNAAFDSGTGDFTPAGGTFELPAGSGPRHLAFHPTLDVLYVINEQGDTVVSATIGAQGNLTQKQVISTLESGQPDPDNACADIHITPDGKYLLGSNRGQNNIVVYSVDASGSLSRIGNTSTGGEWPRNFGLDPNSDIVLVANQQSDNIVTFRLGSDGSLTQLIKTDTQGAPSWVGVVTQPEP